MTPKIELKAKKSTLFFLLLLVIGSVGLDQLSKKVAEENFMIWENPTNSSYYEGKRLHLYTIGTVKKNPKESSYVSFAFNYVRNKGAAFGFLSTLNDRIRTPLFHFVTVMTSILIFFFWRSTPAHHHFTRFSLILVLSGALGNFTDRFLDGFVVDFLDVSWSLPIPFKETNWVYYFPKFNWADSCITAGIFLLFFDMFFPHKDQASKNLEKKPSTY